MQPPRVPVLERVAEILGSSGRNEAEVIPHFTYRALAASVYETDDEPTAAQLSAVRRAVAKLVADGRAERDAERAPLWVAQPDWLIDLPPQRHRRRSKYGEASYGYFNPGGVMISRTPTAEDIEARDAWTPKQSLAELERGIKRRET